MALFEYDIVFISQKAIKARLGFDCTNNMAKYGACAMGITMALEHQVKELKVFADPTLVIYQLCGE
ncbi:hypothetical protein CR513_50077, partial [Mucuna pruriens]